MEHHPFRGAFLAQDLDDVVMGVPVVDLQRQAQPLGDVDVAAERIALMGQPLPLRAEEVEARLADGADPRMRGERFDLGQGIFQFAALRIVRSVVGVDRHGAQQPRVQLDGLDGEPGGFKVAAHLHGALDAHRLGGVQGVAAR